ncbi:MAG: DUF2800 domain-containing protein, partial [Bacteroidetes bacterium]|nr:DUF2800 domain-containing protein [Bacteroidota bacterium]
WCLKQGLDDLDIHEIKLKSPAKVEKLIKPKVRLREDFTSLISKPEGKPTLVTENDKRDAISYRDAAAVFAEIEMVEEI